MRILAHLGYWNNEAEKNMLPALKENLEKGYGLNWRIMITWNSWWPSIMSPMGP